MLLEISEEEIAYAEQILFGSKGHFDKERLNFIRNFNTLDLQAVPGSGKTTVLLAKLLILEKRLPLPDGSAVLIVSHTNVAIEEIVSKIGAHCPKLFRYPNFIGTIQNFVNQFLAIPFFEHHFRSKIVRIDNEIYHQELERSLAVCLKGKLFETFKKVKNIQRANPELISSYRFDKIDGDVVLLNRLNGQQIAIEKPRGKTKDYKDYTPDEKISVTDYLKTLKTKCLRAGVLHYDDAYFLAKAYLANIPIVADYLRLRFPYVFVDEMQDMERHQHDLLEMLFYVEKGSSCYQRIGDINQCIFGEQSSSMEEVWQEREESLTISGSHRLHQSAAKIVQPFGAKKSVPIIGRGQNTNLTPHLIVYTSESIMNVIPTFAELILGFYASGDISTETKYPLKIIGWNGKSSEDGKLRIRDYYPEYQSSMLADRIDFSNLLSYLTFYDKKNKTLEAIRKNILNGILRLLRIDNLTLGDRYFTKKAFINCLKFSHSEVYEKFQKTLYSACISCVRGQTLLAHQQLKEFLPGLIRSIFAVEIRDGGQYFLSDLNIPSFANTGIAIPNVMKYKSLLMSVGTVHSVKGETHTATLYLDTCYHKLESEKSINQLIGKDACLEKQSRRLESAKVMYVGFSRATHLLCYAVEDGRLNEHEDQLIQAGWKIIRA